MHALDRVSSDDVPSELLSFKREIESVDWIIKVLARMEGLAAGHGR